MLCLIVAVTEQYDIITPHPVHKERSVPDLLSSAGVLAVVG